MKIEIKGLDNMLIEVKELQDDLSGAKLDNALYNGAEFLRGQAIKNISRGGRSGRKYKRRSVVHQASAMGEYPKSDTGELVDNITTKKEAGYITMGSRVNAPQGYWLETKPQSEGGRPWLSRTIRENITRFWRIVEGELK